VKEIILVPHPTLREKAKPIDHVDKKLIQLVKDLEETLKKKRNPSGVGLAAPQINTLKRVFSLNVKKLTTYINPKIVKTSQKMTLGEDKKEPLIEGCLSIPDIYGPVWRWQWIEAEFQILENGKLIDKKKRLEDLEARVFQHEFDHLNGILFTDHSLKYELPVYTEYKPGKYQEVERELLEMF
jgi:peptide deformylase